MNYLLILIYRSLAITELKKRHGINENNAIIYIFFDYKSQRTQTAVDIAMSLLKQLISPRDDIVRQIEYCHVKGERPNMAACKELLTFYAEKRHSIYAIFDGLDEYNKSANETSELFGLFTHLQSIRCHLLLSSRPNFFSEFRNRLNEIQTIDIRAEESDLENYIGARIKQVQEGSRNKNKKLELQCLQLATRVDGM
jgi:hypothetical protein